VRILVVLALVVGCRASDHDFHAFRVDGIAGADALWLGGGAVCARTPAGLACAGMPNRGTESAHAAVVAGLGRVTDVAIGIAQACALDDRGVACFWPARPSPARVKLDAPTQVVLVPDIRTLICALDAAGVACWRDDLGTDVHREPTVGKPTRIFAGLGAGGLLCGAYDDGTRCFPETNDARLGAGIELVGASAPTAVWADTAGGHIYAIDGGKALYGEFTGTLHVTGNPFASNDPLAGTVAFRPFTGATVKLAPIPKLGAVTALVAWSTHPILLTDAGVTSIDHFSGWDNKPWPTAGRPSALFGGPQAFYSIQDGTLHRHRSLNSDADRAVAGVAGAVSGAADLFWACVLEQDGGVACVLEPRER